MNIFSAIGNLGKNAEIRYLQNGNPVAQFSFAASSGYGDKKVTTWVNCSLFGKRAETLAPMLLKGNQIGIVGELTNRQYTDKQGVEKYSLELNVSDITLLGSKPNTNERSLGHRGDDGNIPTAKAEHDPMDFDSDAPF
jgi:single-strand DNA-binding protein